MNQSQVDKKIERTPAGEGALLTDRDAATLALDLDAAGAAPLLEMEGAGPRAIEANRARLEPEVLRRRIAKLGLRPTVDERSLLDTLDRLPPSLSPPLHRLPRELRESIEALGPAKRRTHGSKFPLMYFPSPLFRSPCANKFGYLSTLATRNATKLDFANPVIRQKLVELGQLMGLGVANVSSSIPAGFTYVGQFVDHDITLDISSSLDVAMNANTINNMRTPALDLDSLYGDGPALDPFRYVIPASGTAIRMRLGTNEAHGVGGPGGTAGFGGMVVQADHDVPRLGSAPHTALVGDPRNDENLIVSQFHHVMLRFHNAVVDLLELGGGPGDLFLEAKQIVTHHYQWAVMNDFLRRVCGPGAVSTAMTSVTAPVGSPFRMPVEFAVAAYRFGHSMIRDRYWLNHIHINAPLSDVFAFNRGPNLPVHSDKVLDFNAFFETGVPVPVFNRALRIDSSLAKGLTDLPGFTALMKELAVRNLLRGYALGLPSGQGLASQLGVPVMSASDLLSGLGPTEQDLLNGMPALKKDTPLWYYILREARVLESGERLGPLGARIVAETFVRLLKRDPDSFLNASGGFTPFLPSSVPGDFTFADLVIFAGVSQP